MNFDPKICWFTRFVVNCCESNLRTFCRQIHQCAKIGGWEGGSSQLWKCQDFDVACSWKDVYELWWGLMGFWCRIYEFWCRIYATPGVGFCREVDGDYSRAVQAAPADGSISTIGMWAASRPLHQIAQATEPASVSASTSRLVPAKHEQPHQH